VDKLLRGTGECCSQCLRKKSCFGRILASKKWKLPTWGKKEKKQRELRGHSFAQTRQKRFRNACMQGEKLGNRRKTEKKQKKEKTRSTRAILVSDPREVCGKIKNSSKLGLMRGFSQEGQPTVLGIGKIMGCFWSPERRSRGSFSRYKN